MANVSIPESVTNGWFAFAAATAATIIAALMLALGAPVVLTALSAMIAYAICCATLDVALLRVHRRETTGLDWGKSAPVDLHRVLVKILGLTATLAVIAFFFWLFPFFRTDIWANSLPALALAAPILVPVTVAYFFFIDRRMIEPRDGYWDAGALVVGRWQDVELARFRDYALCWVIKALFLPFMFNKLVSGIRFIALKAQDFGDAFVPSVMFIIAILVAIELVIVCVGYACTLRATDSHIRSPNALLGAWVVTLLCYAPVSAVTFRIFNHRDNHTWDFWMSGLTEIVWGLLMIGAYAAWLSASMVYGLRWSNLTNRGIITGGPYRFVKHPTYLTKCLFWWLAYLPFLSVDGYADALRATAEMIVVSLIYYGRAKWEERHLMADPAYVEYSDWISKNGLWARLGRASGTRLPAPA